MDSPEVIATATGGIALLIAFALWEQRAPAPMVPPGLFRSRPFAAGNGAVFFTFAALFSCVFLFAQFFQVALGYSALGAGLRLMPWTITFILIAPVAGTLADRIGERPFMLGGLLLQAVGLGWLALIAEPGIGYGELLPPLVIAGIGVSMAIPAGQSSVVADLPVGELGRAAGATSTMRELGGVFGIAVTVAAFAAAGASPRPPTSPTASCRRWRRRRDCRWRVRASRRCSRGGPRRPPTRRSKRSSRGARPDERRDGHLYGEAWPGRFQSELGDRCSRRPQVVELEEIGSFRFDP